MGRIALVMVVVAGLAAPAGLAAHAPRWTAKGAITKLNQHLIRVDGKSCRITPDSPRAAIRVLFVGSTVKIVCDDDVLMTIDLLKAPSQGSSTTSSSSQSVSSSSSSSSANGASATSSALAIAGDFTISALGNGSITVKSAKSSFTCSVGTGSPDVSGFHVDGHVSKMTCKDDVLTTIAA